MVSLTAMTLKQVMEKDFSYYLKVITELKKSLNKLVVAIEFNSLDNPNNISKARTTTQKIQLLLELLLKQIKVKQKAFKFISTSGYKI